MRILILANNDGGLYKFRRELIIRLVESNEVFICLPNGEFISEFQKLGCIFWDCPFLNRHGTNPMLEIKQLSFYNKVVLEINPDVVFTYTIKPNIYGGIVCAQKNIPYVANITGLGTAVENAGTLQKITLMLYKYALRKAKKVFFQNTENRDFMLEHNIVKSNYDLLPGSGVNLSRFKVLEYPSEDTIEFAFISRIMKEKGIDQYLDAAKQIREKYPNTAFHVCGFCEQDYENTLKNLHNRGIIIYHGMVRDVREILKNIHCTVHPTYYPEGISNVLLESSACARPIITTDRAGCREVIDNGVNGFVVRKKDSADLIEKLKKFIALPWEEKRQMGINGRKKVEQKFDRQIVCEKYMDELNKIS